MHAPLTYKLTANVQGLCSGQLYARRGEPVVLIADHTDVWIVEANGQRFPAPRSSISEEPATGAQLAQPVITEPEASPPPSKQSIGPKKRTKATKTNSSQTPELF